MAEREDYVKKFEDYERNNLTSEERRRRMHEVNDVVKGRFIEGVGFRHYEDLDNEQKIRFLLSNAGRHVRNANYIGAYACLLEAEKRDRYSRLTKDRISIFAPRGGFTKMIAKSVYSAMQKADKAKSYYAANALCELGKKLGKRVRGEKSSGLETTAAATAIIGIVGSIFFLSSNFTGNVIGLNQSTSNFVGAGLFILGLVAAGIYFWKK